MRFSRKPQHSQPFIRFRAVQPRPARQVTLECRRKQERFLTT